MKPFLIWGLVVGSRECPNDVSEAISSLVFASARCGDLPELLLIRKLFGERYGHKFETTAVELSEGNFVNLQVYIYICVCSVLITAVFWCWATYEQSILFVDQREAADELCVIWWETENDEWNW